VINQAKVEKCCRKARQILEKSGDLNKALAQMDRLVDRDRLADAPIELLLARIRLLIDAEQYGRAVVWAEEALANREGPEDHAIILKETRRIPGGALDHQHLYQLWFLSASHGHLAEAQETARGFRLLPSNARKALKTTFAALRQETPDSPLAELGLAHLALSIEHEQGTYAYLARLAARPPPFGAHAAGLLANLPMPGTIELIWKRVVVFLLADRQADADAAINEIVKSDPGALVGFLTQATSQDLLNEPELETTALLALKQAPQSVRIRSFLFELYRDASRLDEALEQLRTLAGIGTLPGGLDGLVVRAEDLVTRFPEQSAPLLTRAWLLGRTDRSEEFSRAVRELLPEVPAKVRTLLREWSQSAGEIAKEDEFLLLGAESTAALGRHADATVELRRLLRSTDDPAALVDPLETFARRYPSHAPYLLILGRARYRASDQEGALLCFETMLAQSPDQADRVLNMLGSWTFDGDGHPHAGVLAVRCLLVLDRISDAVLELEKLVDHRDHLDAGIGHALQWRDRLLETPDLVVKFVSLMFRSGRDEGAIDLISDALTREPGSAPVLARVFDHDHLTGRRELPLLVLKCRLLVEAGRWEDAAEVAIALGDAGHPEQEFRWLTTIRSGAGAQNFRLLRLLATALRVERPTEDVVLLGQTVLQAAISEQVHDAYGLLLERHQATGLGRSGTELLGLMAIELDHLDDAARHFTELLVADPESARIGLERVLALEPQRAAARFALVEDLTARRELTAALGLLLAAPERTDTLWAALEALVEIIPPHFESWDLKSRWLEDAHRWEDLIAHLDRLTGRAGAELPAIDKTLVRITGETAPTPAALWLRVRIARETGRTRDEVDLHHRLAELGPEQFAEIFTRLDGLRQAHATMHDLVMDELKLAGGAHDLARVLATGRAAVDTPELDARMTEVSIILEELIHVPEFTRSRDFLHLAYEVACGIEHRDLAHELFGSLFEFEAEHPAVRVQLCERWRRNFGDDIPTVVLQVKAMIQANRATASIPHIRRVVELGLATDDDADAARRGLPLAEAAAETAPDDPNVHLLASELAATALDPECALRHALSPLGNGNLQPVLRQLECLNLSFERDPRFAHALAVKVHEPIDRREQVAHCLSTMLDRDPATAREAFEIAERLCAHRPAPPLFLSIRARAAVIVAVGTAKAAAQAVDCLRELLETAGDRAGEVLDRVDQVIAHREESLVAHVLREEALRVLGRPRDARVEIEEEILPRTRNPLDEYMARYRLADALEELGNFGAALDEWRRCARLKPGHQEIPLRIRLNFTRHRESQLPATDVGKDLERGVLALWQGAPELALAAVFPADSDDPSVAIARLAVRGNALLILNRHAQLREELLPHLERIPTGGPLLPFDREFLYCLGASSLLTGDESVGLQCLERVARHHPAHRAVRTLLDRHYAERGTGIDALIQVTSTLEEAVR